MATREAFLAKAREAQPPARPRPDVPLFTSAGGDLRARFMTALQAMGGTCVEVPAAGDVLALIRERFGDAASVASATPEVPGTRVITADTEPASLQDIDVGVVRARFGVAETGSVWFSEREYVVNSLGYIVQHLVVLLDPAQLLDGLQDGVPSRRLPRCTLCGAGHRPLGHGGYRRRADSGCAGGKVVDGGMGRQSARESSGCLGVWEQIAASCGDALRRIVGRPAATHAAFEHHSPVTQLSGGRAGTFCQPLGHVRTYG